MASTNDAIAPSGRTIGASSANAARMRSSRGVRRAGSSVHSLARRIECRRTQANGTTSMPLAADQAKPPKRSVIAAAPRPAARPARGRVVA